MYLNKKYNILYRRYVLNSSSRGTYICISKLGYHMSIYWHVHLQRHFIKFYCTLFVCLTICFVGECNRVKPVLLLHTNTHNTCRCQLLFGFKRQMLYQSSRPVTKMRITYFLSGNILLISWCRLCAVFCTVAFNGVAEHRLINRCIMRHI